MKFQEYFHSHYIIGGVIIIYIICILKVITYFSLSIILMVFEISQYCCQYTKKQLGEEVNK